MVEIECPLCTETVELDYKEGSYVCPYCEGELEWEPEETRQIRFIVNENEEDSASVLKIYFLTALAVTLIIMLVIVAGDTIETCLFWILLVPYLIFS